MPLVCGFAYTWCGIEPVPKTQRARVYRTGSAELNFKLLTKQGSREHQGSFSGEWEMGSCVCVRESEGEREREVTTLNGDNKHSGKKMFRYSQHCYFPPRRTLVHLCADYMQQTKKGNRLSVTCM